MTVTAGVLAPPAEDTLPPLRHRSQARRRHVSTALLLAPPAIYFVLLFVVPLVVLLVYSFYTYQNFNFTAKLTLANYTQTLTSPALRDFYFRTLKIAFLVSIIVVAVSYVFSHILMYVLPRARRVLFFLVLVSLFGGYLVRIYAWRTMLGRDGVVNSFLIGIHVVSSPVSFLLNSNFAIVIALLNFLIPLGVLPIFSAMQNISPRLLEAAEDLGHRGSAPSVPSCSPSPPGESGPPSPSVSSQRWRSGSLPNCWAAHSISSSATRSSTSSARR